MNGYLGEEGTFGYLAQSAGGVRKLAAPIRAANPVNFIAQSAVIKLNEQMALILIKIF